MICKCGTELTDDTAIWDMPYGGSAKRLKPVCKDCQEAAIRTHGRVKAKFWRQGGGQRRAGYGTSIKYNEGTHLGGD